MKIDHHRDLKTLVQKVFPPRIAVLSSPDADAVARKNNLSFCEMVAPFSKMTIEGNFRDPSGAELKLKSLHILLQEMNHRPPAPVVAKKLLSDSVLLRQTAESSDLNTGYVDIQIPANQPWYDDWKETFFSVQEVYEHEFIRNFIACIFVVSSSHSNPAEQFNRFNQVLNQQLSQAPQPVGLVYQAASQSLGGLKSDTPKQPKLFSASIPRYFLLLHDATDGNAAKAESVYQSLKTTYGGHACYLLVINSRSTVYAEDGVSLPNPWLNYLPRKPVLQVEPEPPDPNVDSSLPLSIEEGEQVIGESQEAELLDAMREPSPGGKLRPSQSEISLTSLSGGSTAPAGMNGVVGGRLSHGDLTKMVVMGSKTDSQYSSANSLTSISGLGPLTVSDDLDRDLGNVPHGACLTTEDQERIQTFVNEFCTRTLLPSVERQMKDLYNTVLSRKSAQTSIFSATKRLFGSKPRQGGLISSGLYQFDSPPLQVRRLADLAFIFGHYDVAYEAYHTAKKDFESDQAWIYYAGALEMAALSVVLHNMVNPDAVKPVPHRYFETALNTYTGVCKHPMLGLRTGILSYETLRESKQYAEAAKLCVRLTSEDSDLRSALMLEQAAYCFAKMQLPFVGHDAPALVPRACKYAFHLILAGHRFAKAGQRRHAARAYKQALVVYEGTGWTLAEDHILLTLGRYMLQLKEATEAVTYLSRLLHTNSKQAAAQQHTFLREFVAAGQEQQKELFPSKLPELPVPSIDSQRIRVLIGQHEGVSTNPDVSFASGISINDDDALHPRWNRLEELLLRRVRGNASSSKPTNQLLTEKTNNVNKPVCFSQEPVQISIPVHNELRIPLLLENLYLLWKFKPNDNNDAEFTNEVTNDVEHVTVDVVTAVEIPAEGTTQIILQLTPKYAGELDIIGFAYALVSRSADNLSRQAVLGKKLFTIRGPRLNNTAAERRLAVYAPDRRLNLAVVPNVPRIKVTFTEVPDFMLCGELRRVNVCLTNVGETPLQNFHVAYSDPKAIWFKDTSLSDSWVSKICIPMVDDSDVVKPGMSVDTSFWVRANDDSGLMSVDLLFYCENVDEEGKIVRWRCVRHTLQIFLSDSIAITAKSLRGTLLPTSAGFTDLISVILHITSRRDPSDPVLGAVDVEKISVLSSEWNVSAMPEFETLKRIGPLERANFVVACTAVQPLKSEGSSEIATDDPGVNLARRCISNYGPLLSNNVDKNDAFSEESYEKKLSRLLTEAMEINIPVCIRWKTHIKDESDDSAIVVSGVHCINLQTLNKAFEIPPVTSAVPSLLTSESKILKFLTFDENGDIVRDDDRKRLLMLESEIAKCICYRLEYQSTVQHNFDQLRLCVIPVKVVIFNSFKKSVEVRLAAVDPRLPPRNQLYLPEALAPFTVAGISQTWTSLKPRTSVELKWSVCVSAPGTYCLDHRLKLDCRVAVEGDDKRKVFGQLLKFDFELLVTSL